MNVVETEQPKKTYVPAFSLDDLDFDGVGINRSELSPQDVKSLESKNRTSVLKLIDPANNSLKVEGRLLVKKIENKWTLYPEYKNTTKLEIHNTILGAIIYDEDKVKLRANKSIEKELVKDGKPFTAIIVIDPELNRLIIIPKRPLPTTLLQTVLSDQQRNDFLLGKPFLVKGTSKQGKNMARVITRNVITGEISSDFPNAKGEALNKTYSSKVEETQNLKGENIKEKVNTTNISKTEPETEALTAPEINLDVYKDKIKARKQPKETKAKSKTSVKL